MNSLQLNKDSFHKSCIQKRQLISTELQKKKVNIQVIIDIPTGKTFTVECQDSIILHIHSHLQTWQLA